SDSGPACLKFALGWTESKRPEDIYDNARAAYVRHYKQIRETVPAEQLLNFEHKDGWEPLCRFLGKEVPDVPYPHINDSAAYTEHRKDTRNDIFKRVARNLCFPCF
ncbi:MAG: sulfotransferase, partial [Candidatus Binatia bacterium]